MSKQLLLIGCVTGKISNAVLNPSGWAGVSSTPWFQSVGNASGSNN